MPLVEWAAAARPLEGERLSGDAHFVREDDRGVLLAAFDGLGHGEGAHRAAALGVAALERSRTEQVTEALQACHEALSGSRGAALTLAFLRPGGELSWIGVGNVEGVVLRAAGTATGRHERLLVRPGAAGAGRLAMRAGATVLRPLDALVLATDGVGADFVTSLDPRAAPRALAPELLARHRRATDDALVLVARYLGGAA